MYKIQNNTVLNDDKKILSFENSEDAKHFANAASYMDNMEEANEGRMITTIKEFKMLREFKMLKESFEEAPDNDMNNIDKNLASKLYVGDFIL